jgi:transposase
MRELATRGWGIKRIARELRVARNTVRSYLRRPREAGHQERPEARVLDDNARTKAVQLFSGRAEGNAVVVQRMLAATGVEASVRTVQRSVAKHRREQRIAQLATVRFETAPGQQMQIDFGEKRVRVAGLLIKVHFLVAVLCFSRRIFVKAFLGERQDDWLEGIACAFRHFGGVPRVLLGDNPKALVLEHNRAAATVTFHPAYTAFCRDWGIEPRACQPYRARTKGKTESGVKYVKRNAVAGEEFASFAALETHLASWMTEADRREHGTTHELPSVRFEREERDALRPLPENPLPARQQRLVRRVANDALVDVATVRYSVPHRLVRDRVEVVVGETEVRIFHGSTLVAKHARSREPFAVISDPAHYDGLWRRSRTLDEVAVTSPPSPTARSLEVYAAALAEGAR